MDASVRETAKEGRKTVGYIKRGNREVTKTGREQREGDTEKGRENK